MPRDQKRVPGSRREPLANAKPAGEVDPKHWIEVLVRLRSRVSDAGRDARLMEMNSKYPGERTIPTRESLAASRGADPKDLAKIETFAHTHHLTVREASIPKRTLRLAGTAADMCRAFGVTLRKYKAKDLAYRGREGYLYVPGELSEIVEGVFGLDNRPVAGPRHRRVSRKASKTSRPASFNIAEVTQHYDFPQGLNGDGQCIALIELNDINTHDVITGTGYSVSDLRMFFKKTGVPVPDISAVGVMGGANKPGRDAIADTEVSVDIEIAGTVAPGAKIAVYFTPNTRSVGGIRKKVPRINFSMV